MIAKSFLTKENIDLEIWNQRFPKMSQFFKVSTKQNLYKFGSSIIECEYSRVRADEFIRNY